MPAEFIQASIWAKIEPRKPKHTSGGVRHESTAEIFRTCAGQRTRRRVTATCAPGTGSIVLSVRAGRYTSIACKHKM